ncbi:hypothetical protein PHLGIDRAFT_120297 [Phlebiopsis gigantea 11061_1 CR5-6]|uniref:PUB domain-containing protein n=1 Tax=Phlebiopsis gigantea (strain 11061_1 CR5-6) TaxID=745531 RepID=A0A0C3S492_PHLG1|nr:hypothetical protein PHLGIDRAFT_120297 [Phlebiopsis gigantea 11061_1 CR5-6]
MDAGHEIPHNGAPQEHTLSDIPMAPAPLNSNAVADALEQRIRERREKEQEAAAATAYVAFDEYHHKRQNFRRMVDPGILRPNARPVALESLKTLLTLAENILNNPYEEKYQKFKPTNGTIKRLLVDPKGTLEYAREMGFNPEVVNFQPFYVFNKKKHMVDLRIGAEILKETLDREVGKEERILRAKQDEKAVAAAHVANIKQAFLDDRKSRAVQERREKELREARAAVALRRASQSPATPPAVMPGSGKTLSGNTSASVDDNDDE